VRQFALTLNTVSSARQNNLNVFIKLSQPLIGRIINEVMN